MHNPNYSRSTSASNQPGFTLIEMMVVIAIIAIVSSLALPFFESQLQKARRADALTAVMQIQLAQERYRSVHNSYGGLADVGVSVASSSGHYQLQSIASGADGFDVDVTAAGLQARDAACSHMRLSVRSGRTTYSSGTDQSFANGAANNQACWMTP